MSLEVLDLHFVQQMCASTYVNAKSRAIDSVKETYEFT